VARQLAGTRRQRGRHVDDDLTTTDQLLSEQMTQPVDVLDRPHPLTARRPAQQRIDLARAGVHTQLRRDLFRLVEHDRGMRPLVGIHPDDGCRHALLLSATSG